jgi:hypothetical protein
VANEEIRNLLQTGIQAAQRGNQAVAQQIFRQVIDLDPNNETAWIWMASVVSSMAERRTCLQRVLTINPNNRRARQALQRLEQSMRPSEPPTTRLTPPVGRPTPAGVPRDALLGERGPAQRRPSALLYMTVAVLAVVMIVLGLWLLRDYLQEEDKTPAAATDQSNIPPAAVVAPMENVSPMPSATSLVLFPEYYTPEAAEATPSEIPDEPIEVPIWTPTDEPIPPSPTPTNTPPAPLSDYELVVSARHGEQAGMALYTMSADGNGEQGISLLPASTDGEAGTGFTLLRAYNAVVAPPDSVNAGKIAFTARVRAESTEDETPVSVEYEEIFIASAEGGPIERLTTLKANNTEDAAWSPDGTRIAFASDEDGDYDIYVISVEDGVIDNLTDNDEKDRQPTWSPNGAYIAFTSDRESRPGLLQIWQMAADGTGARQLTEEPRSYAPDWSPAPSDVNNLDKEMIIFVSDRGGDADLFIMDADGQNERLLTTRDDAAEDRNPAWSPDGKWIAFSSNRDSDTFEIFLIRPDGDDLRQITTGQGDTDYPHWKP